MENKIANLPYLDTNKNCWNTQSHQNMKLYYSFVAPGPFLFWDIVRHHFVQQKISIPIHLPWHNLIILSWEEIILEKQKVKSNRKSGGTLSLDNGRMIWIGESIGRHKTTSPPVRDRPSFSCARCAPKFLLVCCLTAGWGWIIGMLCSAVFPIDFLMSSKGFSCLISTDLNFFLWLLILLLKRYIRA